MVRKKEIAEVMAHLGRQRAKKLSAAQRKQIASGAGSAAWAKLSAEERSAEMKRRAQVRARNRKKKVT